MKEKIHPEFNELKLKCTCGQEHIFGSTSKELKIEICSACHPFYTGNEKTLDSAGRVDKFRKRMEAAKKK